jgi:hypothetical protein
MPGLCAGHPLFALKNIDGRDKPGQAGRKAKASVSKAFNPVNHLSFSRAFDAKTGPGSDWLIGS